MENKWEYDYSNTNPSGHVPDEYNPIPQYDEPQTDAPQPPAGEPGQPRKPHRILAGVLAVAVVAAVSFGGGYAGYRLADRTAGTRVVYQAASGTSTSAAPGAQDLSGVLSTITPSVVAITTEQMVTTSFWGGQQIVSGAGSGVIITTDGYIITNAHVVEGAQQITVQLSDGRELSAQLIGSDSQSDVAVVKVDATDLTPAVLANSDDVVVGQVAIAVGNPSSLGITATDGIISALNRSITVEGNTMSLMQTSAAISPGNSGGGLFNAQGQLVGIVNAKNTSEYAEGLGFAIPVNTAMSVAQDLMESGYVTGRPALGISVLTIGDLQTAMQYGVSTLGAYVTEVSEGGGAANAGMKPGDRIVSMGAKTIMSATDVTNFLKDYSAGDTIQVQVDRKGDLITLEVVLGERQG